MENNNIHLSDFFATAFLQVALLGEKTTPRVFHVKNLLQSIRCPHPRPRRGYPRPACRRRSAGSPASETCSFNCSDAAWERTRVVRRVTGIVRRVARPGRDTTHSASQKASLRCQLWAACASFELKRS